MATPRTGMPTRPTPEVPTPPKTPVPTPVTAGRDDTAKKPSKGGSKSDSRKTGR